MVKAAAQPKPRIAVDIYLPLPSGNAIQAKTTFDDFGHAVEFLGITLRGWRKQETAHRRVVRRLAHRKGKK